MPASKKALACATLLALCACDDGPGDQPLAADAGSLASCRPGERPALPPGRCEPVGWNSCPAGFSPSADGFGCVPALPAGDCPAGTMPTLGKTDCVPVGPAHCAEGFALAEGGWGCLPILPAGPCPEGTLARLGETSCQPLGDCAAGPPAEALLVDDGYSGPADGVHFASISAALAAAADGATVFVEEGRYREPVHIERPVRLVGRCPARVTIEGAGQPRAVEVIGAKDVAISGLTLTGFVTGVVFAQGAQGAVADCLITGNSMGAVSLQDAGSRLTISRSALVANARASGGDGATAVAFDGSTLALEDCDLAGNWDVAAAAQGAGTQLRLVRTALRDTRRRDDGQGGWGVISLQGGSVSMERSAVVGGAASGAAALDAASRLLMTESVVAGVKSGLSSTNKPGATGLSVIGGEAVLRDSTVLGCDSHGAEITRGGRAVLERSVVSATRSPAPGVEAAALALSGAEVEVRQSAIAANDGHGLLAVGETRVLLEDSLVARSRPVEGSPMASGAGVVGQDSAEVTIRRSAFVGNATASIFVRGEDASLIAESSVVADTGLGSIDGVEATTGFGIDVAAGASARLSGVAVLRSVSVGLLGSDEGTEVSAAGIYVSQVAARDPASGIGYGIACQLGAKVTVSGAAVEGASAIAAFASSGTRLTLSRTAIRATRRDRYGRAFGAVAQQGAQVSLQAVAFHDNEQAHVVVVDGGTEVRLKGSLLAGGEADPANLGYGVVALGGGRADALDSTAVGMPGAAFLFSGGQGLLGGCALANNQVALHVQDGSALSEQSSLPEEPGPRQVVMGTDCFLQGNETRLGAGFAPLPVIEL